MANAHSDDFLMQVITNLDCVIAHDMNFQSKNKVLCGNRSHIENIQSQLRDLMTGRKFHHTYNELYNFSCFIAHFMFSSTLPRLHQHRYVLQGITFLARNWHRYNENTKVYLCEKLEEISLEININIEHSGVYGFTRLFNYVHDGRMHKILENIHKKILADDMKKRTNEHDGQTPFIHHYDISCWRYPMGNIENLAENRQTIQFREPCPYDVDRHLSMKNWLKQVKNTDNLNKLGRVKEIMIVRETLRRYPVPSKTWATTCSRFITNKVNASVYELNKHSDVYEKSLITSFTLVETYTNVTTHKVIRDTFSSKCAEFKLLTLVLHKSSCFDANLHTVIAEYSFPYVYTEHQLIDIRMQCYLAFCEMYITADELDKMHKHFKLGEYFRLRKTTTQ